MALPRTRRALIAVVAALALAIACSSSGGRPRIDGTLPSSAGAQSGSFVMIQGDHFARNAEVRLGQSPLAGVTWINAQLLSAQIPGGMQPGPYGITVANPGSGETTLSGAFTVVAAPGTTAPAPAMRPAPPAQSATQPPVRAVTAEATASPAATPPSAPFSSPTSPPSTVQPASPATAPPTVAPSRSPTAAATRLPAQPQIRSQSSVDLSGQWTIVDSVTYGPGAGATYQFSVIIEQSGNSISGRGDGISFSGTIDGSHVHVGYVQSNGSGGSFDWLLDSGGNALAGSFTNSIGNGGDSVGQRTAGGLFAAGAPAPLRSVADSSGYGRAKKKER